MNRATFRYWIDGDGQWRTHWHCTGEDWLLAAVLIPGFIVMALLYRYYARQNEQAMEVVREPVFKEHLRRLMRVFVMCSSIHLLGAVVSYFVPLHWMTAILVWVNAWMTLRLIKSKSQTVAIQRMVEGEQAVERVSDALGFIQSKERANLHDDLGRIESILKRIDPARSLPADGGGYDG